MTDLLFLIVHSLYVLHVNNVVKADIVHHFNRILLLEKLMGCFQSYKPFQNYGHPWVPYCQDKENPTSVECVFLILSIED